MTNSFNGPVLPTAAMLPAIVVQVPAVFINLHAVVVATGCFWYPFTVKVRKPQLFFRDGSDDDTIQP
jgi:hypothetical protein